MQKPEPSQIDLSSPNSDPDLGALATPQEKTPPRSSGAPTNLKELQEYFFPLFAGSGGIDSWLSNETPTVVIDRLLKLKSHSLSRAQFSQLLVQAHEARLSEAFYRFYWKTVPPHLYDVRKVGVFEEVWLAGTDIVSLEHLRWGFTRFYMDALLLFGNIRSAYRTLRDLSPAELTHLFASKRIPTEALVSRGPSLPLNAIKKDDRYLVAEVACKTLDGGQQSLQSVAIEAAYAAHIQGGGSRLVSFEELLSGDYVQDKYPAEQQQLHFASDELLETRVSSVEDLKKALQKHGATFEEARASALGNTSHYLSMVDEMDVYVATSMRTRQDFRDMASFCDEVFGHRGLTKMHVRYFDPTLSAARGHVDKGLVECLMVKAAKVLVYCAGTKESYGKDAEAAMALSRGKPVIFYCDSDQREAFYRDVHPLARLIEFDTGVTVGALVTSKKHQVAELLHRIFRNEMEYELVQQPDGYLLLREKLTGSTVRLQTNDVMLRETFWNHYHEA